MGNRLSSGSTGDFQVEVFSLDGGDDDSDGEGASLVAVGEAVYTAEGEYAGAHNVTAAGDYTLHVRRPMCCRPAYRPCCPLDDDGPPTT